MVAMMLSRYARAASISRSAAFISEMPANVITNPPLDATVLALIGQHAAYKSSAVVGFHFASHRRAAREHGFCIRQESGVLEPACHVGKRPAHVAGNPLPRRGFGEDALPYSATRD
jgi:hypothetical protein